MNIAIAQPNLIVADFEKNTSKIINIIQKSYAQGADVVVFPELAVGGCPAFDLNCSSDFQQACQEAITRIAGACDNIACIIGTRHVQAGSDASDRVYNAAYFICNGKIETVVTKKTPGVFTFGHERAYFTAGTGAQIISYKQHRFCVAIGDDPAPSLKDVHGYIRLRNQPFSYIQHDIRLMRLRTFAETNRLPIWEVNQVGAQGNVIFAGRSTVVDAEGQWVDEAQAFEEDLRFYQLQSGSIRPLQKARKKNYTEIALIHDALVLGIKDFFDKQGFTKAIIGLSGGLDSALVASLASKALGADNIHCILMPSRYSTDHSVKDAEDLVKNLGCAHTVLPIQAIVAAFESTLEPLFKGLPFGLAEENLQARSRGSLVMAIANKFGGIVLNTSNKSEAAAGYGTLYGDLVGSLSVLGDVYKTQAYELAHYINREQEVIPGHILQKAPSAELRPGQKDSDSLPEYDKLDPVLFQYVDLGRSVTEIAALGYDRAFVLQVAQLVDRMEFKRHQAPPILGVSNRPFGSGRKIPEVKQVFPLT